jgi:XRE family transcriptional regulator, aerobic/anaerobic benzoate catabolism transcriptional regulator
VASSILLADGRVQALYCRRAMELLEQLGTRVRSLRRGRGMTLKALAGASGLSERFVGDLEAGRANISVKNLAEVADVLGVEPSALLAREEAKDHRGVIALLGLRGAGKSTIGRALAEKLDAPFYELDALVEAEAGMRLAEIFAIHGEEYFRQAELSALKRFFAAHPRAVLATGGGIVTSPEAFRLLEGRAHTIWLKATPEEHWQRVVHQGDFRPMQNRPHAMAELKRRLREREPLYARAEQVCVTSGRPVSSVAAELSRRYGGAPT